MKNLSLPSIVSDPVTLTFCYILILVLMLFPETGAAPHTILLLTSILLYTLSLSQSILFFLLSSQYQSSNPILPSGDQHSATSMITIPGIVHLCGNPTYRCHCLFEQACPKLDLFLPTKVIIHVLNFKLIISIRIWFYCVCMCAFAHLYVNECTYMFTVFDVKPL